MIRISLSDWGRGIVLVLWRNLRRAGQVIALCAGALFLYVAVPFMYLGTWDAVVESSLRVAAWSSLLAVDLHAATPSAAVLYWAGLTMVFAAITLVNHFPVRRTSA